MAVDVRHEADAPQRRRPPFAAGGLKIRAAVRQALAHIVQQQVRVRVYDLMAQGRNGMLARRERRRMALGAPSLQKGAGARAHLGIVYVAHGRHRQGTRIKDDFQEPFVRHFRDAAMEGGPALRLDGRAVFVRKQGGRNADVAVKGGGYLLFHGRDVGFPSEAAQRRGAAARVPDFVGTARDAVPVPIVGIRQGPNGRLGDGFQQPQADDGRANPGREPRVRVQGAERQVFQRVAGSQQRIGFAVRVGAVHRFVADRHASLDRKGREGAVLQLRTVARVAGRAPVRQDAGHAQAYEQARRPILRPGGRAGAAVQRVAGRAGRGIESGPQPVAGGGRGRRGHPVLLEKTVADLELPPFGIGQVARGQAEGVPGGRERRRIPSQAFLQQRIRLGVARRGATAEQAQDEEAPGRGPAVRNRFPRRGAHPPGVSHAQALS